MTKEIDDAACRNASVRDDSSAALALLDDANSDNGRLVTVPSKLDIQPSPMPSKIDSSQTLEITPVQGFHHPVRQFDGASISVDFDINNKAHFIRDATGNEPHRSSIELGFIGYGSSRPGINTDALRRVTEDGRFGADVQSTIISGEINKDLPLASKYLRTGAVDDISKLANHKSDAIPDHSQTVQTLKEQVSSPKPENRFSAHPEQYNVLDVRRNLPPNFNANGSSDYVLNALSSKAKRDESAAQYTDVKGNLHSRTEIKSGSGNVSTEISVANQDQAEKIRLLFFSINNTEHKDFPTAVIDVANRLKFNADSMRGLQLAEREKDPTVRRAIELAIVQQQLKQYGTKYFDIAWDEAEKLPLKCSSNEDLAASKVRIENILNDMSQTRKGSVTDLDSRAVLKTSEPEGRGLTGAEKAEAAKLYGSLFSREDYLRCVGREKYNW